VIEALLHGKLSPKQENMEDILTSNVFGLLQYVPHELGLFPLLAKAKTIEGESPLYKLAEARGTVDFDFWPQWRNCEPDVELFVQCADGCLYSVGVEAKYHSGKSSEAEELEEGAEEQIEADCTDQLNREWIALVEVAAERVTTPVLLYLTADVGFPKEQIQNSLDEYRRKCRGSLPPVICWLSWRELSSLFCDRSDARLATLGRMLDKMGLYYYRGVSLEGRIHADWVFHQGWSFETPRTTCEWRFRK
jgi:hypothetical protein